MFTYDAQKNKQSKGSWFYIDGIPVKDGKNVPSESQMNKLKANPNFKKKVEDGIIVLDGEVEESVKANTDEPTIKRTIDEVPATKPVGTK